ncbi:glucose-1-phosphate adenylyltransferase small subunit, chloroplastic/amyloplastic-like isoform X1 [Camellia sinensis]|uniref:glucose-1-phosphate adenylyltransferase small subunit, chloroplastic/amyloplastic-like isoform X1 n=1 Tax=Camellia sinensis TaxID=4442 RepID=UPI001036DDCD|nr:glucose-1-phosphate adenylyltransferase small subunit, chloroplastic/amyloplastic-like isoform X1 [Camellia sinensis]
MIRRIRRLVSILMQADEWNRIFLQNVLGIILGGGAGTRLYPLTKKRAKLVPLGANYRLIDIPVRNCLNRNISKIYVLTQFNSASLNHHLSWAYTSNMGGYKNEAMSDYITKVKQLLEEATASA